MLVIYLRISPVTTLTVITLFLSTFLAYVKTSEDQYVVIDVYGMGNNIVVTSMYNSSVPGHYTTYINDPYATTPYVTTSPISRPEIAGDNYIYIFGETIQIPLYPNVGYKRRITPLFNVSLCQSICVSNTSITDLSLFSANAVVYTSSSSFFSVNVTNSNKLYINEEFIPYGIVNCSISTFTIAQWSSIAFLTLFSLFLVSLFIFEVTEYLRYRAEMKDPLIIGGDIRTISTRNFTMESLESIEL
ncbi:uncharacterized protein CMU_017510 [Cryptosporidium muris RN66]|uniref:Uncharacterized protein n=1 Tax=Cryptosporidium muris (strain RN66) TaxID=441375 RepID=B6ACZ4_CRYMR|nr:uncharacterized protein CMU_017510 [Cryptosporidium muris RN66]EEA05998.1 hypothetical protein, conserved [Cryptosporidium muris RN66]|eukprot:XP_002140347.1 hypothetical protein [Cryptosporidium muris RN66]